MGFEHIVLSEILRERKEVPCEEKLRSGQLSIVEKISFSSGKISLRAAGSTKTKMILVQPGDLLVSGINAAKGAIAVYDEKNSKPVSATIHYGAYQVDKKRANTQFLWWMFRSNMFKDLLAHYVPGGIKTELKAKRLLPIAVPLPNIDRQNEIVARIEAVNAKIEAAKQLRQQINEDMDALLIAMAHRNDLSDTEKAELGWCKVALGDVLTQVSDPVAVEPSQEYPHFGIYSFAKGLFKKAPLLGDEIKAAKLYRVHEGQLIYGRLNAYEGAFAVVSAEYDQNHVSNEFPSFDCDPDRVLPEFLLAYFSAPAVWESMKRKVTGIGGGAGNRRIRLKESVFLAEEIWLPPIEWQEKIKLTAAKLAATKTEREAADLELEALLPSILDKAFKGEL